MKKILILGSRDAEHATFDKILRQAGAKVRLAELGDLDFDLDGEKTRIILRNTDEDVRDFDMVIVMAMAKEMINFSRYSALSCYCQKYQIRLADEPSISDLFGKVYQMWQLWAKGVTVPRTAFGDTDFLCRKLADYGGKGVLKPVLGSMGNDNYLVSSSAEIRKIVGDNTNSDCHKVFMLQEYIKNDLDLRLYSLDYQAKLAVVRTATTWENCEQAKFGLNLAAIPDPLVNTSPIATTKTISEAEVLELLPNHFVLKKVAATAVAAAKALKVGLAGVDLVWDGEKAVVVEVNRTPHIVYKAFAREKMATVRDWLLLD